MPINVNNPEADALTRKFASMAGVSITDAIVIAMKEAIERRRNIETPQQTAARLREVLDEGFQRYRSILPAD